MGHKVIDNTQNTAVQDQLEALKQLKDRLASHTKFSFYLNALAWICYPKKHFWARWNQLKSDNAAKDKVNITHY